MRVVGSVPGHGAPRFYVARMAAIARACRVWLANGYLVPTHRECTELARAACKGVDVRLLVAGASGQPVVKTAQESFYGALLAAGVRIVELWQAVLHAKVGVSTGPGPPSVRPTSTGAASHGTTRWTQSCWAPRWGRRWKPPWRA